MTEILFSRNPSPVAELDLVMAAELNRQIAIDALLNDAELSPEMILQMAQLRLDDLDSQVQDIMAAMSATTEQARAAGARLTDLRNLLTALEPGLSATGTLDLSTELPALPGVEQNLEQFARSMVTEGRITQAEADLLLSGPNGLHELWSLVAGSGSNPARAEEIAGWVRAAGFADGPGTVLVDHTRAVTQTVDRYLNDAVASGRITPEERAAIVSGGREAITNLVSDANDQIRDINSQNEMMMIKLQSAMQNRTTILTSTTNLLKAMDEGNDAIVANLR